MRALVLDLGLLDLGERVELLRVLRAIACCCCAVLMAQLGLELGGFFVKELSPRVCRTFALLGLGYSPARILGGLIRRHGVTLEHVGAVAGTRDAVLWVVTGHRSSTSDQLSRRQPVRPAQLVPERWLA